ncbi:hypothetical protein [Acinetobacter bereziniae]|uniref:hypothetical protein n=1 Tax=Acinetobacter bereziniae TaxID=106648 RepID=UPI0030186F12
MTNIQQVWFDRDKAKDCLAKMNRGDAVRINGIRVEFDDNGNFITWDGLRSDVCTPSLNKVLSYMFDEGAKS